jgi:hypothetical protein
VTALAFIGPCSALAHDESTTVGDFSIDSISASPARAGQTTRITFRIENTGTDRIIVTGVRLAGNEPSRVIGSFGTIHSGDIGSFPVPSGEIGDLDGKTAWIEVGPLKHDLVKGSIVEGRLLLSGYDAPLSLHVTANPANASEPVQQKSSATASGWFGSAAGC